MRYSRDYQRVESDDDGEPKDCEECASPVVTDGCDEFCANCGLVHDDDSLRHRAVVHPSGRRRGSAHVDATPGVRGQRSPLQNDDGEPFPTSLTRQARARYDGTGTTRLVGGFFRAYNHDGEYGLGSFDTHTEDTLWIPHLRA